MKPFYKDWQYWMGTVAIWIGVSIFKNPQLSILNWRFWLTAGFVVLGIGILYKERSE